MWLQCTDRYYHVRIENLLQLLQHGEWQQVEESVARRSPHSEILPVKQIYYSMIWNCFTSSQFQTRTLLESGLGSNIGSLENKTFDQLPIFQSACCWVHANLSARLPLQDLLKCKWASRNMLLFIYMKSSNHAVFL